jgi:uncharacterized damage-inducible protein DinB
VAAMELAAPTAEIYVRYACAQMHAVIDRLDDEQVNVAPFGPTTNSVAGLIVHSCGVGEFWLGHVGLGRESARDRDREFTATRTVRELHDALDAALIQISADIRSLDGGEASDRYAAGRQFLEEGDGTDAALVVHVIEELFQHLGHMDITADALTIKP